MSEIGRSIATVFIWIMAGSIAITAVIAGQNDISSTIPVVGIAMGVAFVTTAAVWSRETISRTTSSRRDTQEQSYEKAKRGGGESRMSMLLQMMNEDEREAFKETLKRRILDDATRGGLSDGELPTSLSELMNEPRQDKRLR